MEEDTVRLCLNGYERRKNDLLYKHPKSEPDSSVVVYFPGDVQDFSNIMKSHPHNQNYVEWSLENMVSLLNGKFPRSHIVVVRPFRMELKLYSCFDNFVPCNKFGVPDHVPMNSALLHLECLLRNLTGALEKKNFGNLRPDPSLDQMNLYLVGFSKGCVVLNQFLNEFHHLLTKNVKTGEIGCFPSRIKAMYWLDAGHSGRTNTWITSDILIKTIARLGIDVHIHVSPYQIRDETRPWIQEEEKVFYRCLKESGAHVKRTVHGENDEANLVSHFQVLNLFKTDVP